MRIRLLHCVVWPILLASLLSIQDTLSTFYRSFFTGLRPLFMETFSEFSEADQFSGQKLTISQQSHANDSCHNALVSSQRAQIIDSKPFQGILKL